MNFLAEFLHQLLYFCIYIGIAAAGVLAGKKVRDWKTKRTEKEIEKQ